MVCAEEGGGGASTPSSLSRVQSTDDAIRCSCVLMCPVFISFHAHTFDRT